MADNFNINTTQDQSLEAGGLEKDNPSMTYVDFANQIARNSQAQQAQAEAIKQAQLLTQQKTAAAAAGINPSEKGYMSKDAALALIQAELSRQKLLSDEVKTQLQAWYDAAPDMVEQQDVKDFISRYQPKEPKAGSAFIATDEDAKNPSMLTKEGDHLVAGQSYFDTGEKDEDGNAVYGRGGGEALNAQENKLGVKESEADEKQWQKMGTLIESAMKSRSGPVGMLGTTIIRSLRALNTLNHGKLTKQDVANVSSDIAAIYQGGVPSIVQVAENNYGTRLQDLAETLRRYTGILSYFGNEKVMADTTAKLRQVLEDMRNSAVEQMQKFVEMQFPFFEDIINRNPDRWERVQKGVLDFITAGQMNPTGEAMPPSGQPKQAGAATEEAPEAPAANENTPGTPDIHAIAAALGLKKKAQ